MEQKNILITGANGYLGSNIIRNLASSNHNLFAIVRKQSDTSMLRDFKLKIFYGNFHDETLLETALDGIDIVIHCAALVDPTNSQKEKMMEINYNATKTLINACIKKSVERFIYISSSNVLTLGQENFVDGKYNACTTFNLNKSCDWYTKTKALATNYVNFCGEKGYIKTNIIFPTCIIGPNFSKPTAPHVMMQLYAKGKIGVRINGGYNFVDVRTVAEAVCATIDRAKNLQNFVVGGQFVSVQDMFKKLSDICHVKPPKIKLPNWLVLFGARCLEKIFKNKNPLFSYSGIKFVLKNADFNNSDMKNLLKIQPISVEQSLADSIGALIPQQQPQQLSLLD